MRNEQCWVLKGKNLGWFWRAKYDRYTVGVPAQVAFDPDYVWDNRNDIVGWIHTHPNWTAHPSSTDVATMNAQVNAIGRPLLCCILGTDGLRAWWFFNDESPAKQGRIVRTGNRLFGYVPRKPK